MYTIYVENSDKTICLSKGQLDSVWSQVSALVTNLADDPAKEQSAAYKIAESLEGIIEGMLYGDKTDVTFTEDELNGMSSIIQMFTQLYQVERLNGNTNQKQLMDQMIVMSETILTKINDNKE